MSLYLVGKTIENTLVLASDGRVFTGNKDYIHSDTTPKIKLISPELVTGTVGLVGLTDILEDTVKEIGPTDTGNLLKNVLTRSSPKIKKYLEDQTEPFEPNVAGMCDVFVRHRGEYQTGRIVANVEEPYVEVDNTDATMKFPIRTGGVPEFTNEIVLRSILKYGTSHDAQFMKGLFLYVLEVLADTNVAVGGNMFFREMSDRGYRHISLTDRLEIDLIAESIKDELESTNPLEDTSNIVSSQQMLREASLALRDPTVSLRLARNAYAHYKIEGRPTFVDSAKALYETFSVLKDDPKITLDSEVGFDLILLGDLYQETGDTEKAVQAYFTVQDLAAKYFAVERKQVSLRAIKSYVLMAKRLTTLNSSFKETYQQIVDSAIRRQLLTAQEIEELDVKLVVTENEQNK